MKIINNQDLRLLDELKKSITINSKVYLSSNHFTTFAMFELIETLSVAKQVSILLSYNPTDVTPSWLRQRTTFSVRSRTRESN